MNLVDVFVKKLAILFRRNRFRSDLDEEMAFHRAQAEAELVQSGMSSEDARYAAIRRFGNATRIHERAHETVGFRLETVVHDMRYAIRQLLGSPAFTIIILLTLALAIGAKAAAARCIRGGCSAPRWQAPGRCWPFRHCRPGQTASS